MNWKVFLQIVIGLVIIAAIVLAIVLPKDKNNKDEEKPNDRDNGSETKTGAMEPVTVGEFTYKFEGINWIFENAEEENVGVPLTRVNFMFENFSRREGIFATFAKPYKLGAYQGECSEVTSLDYDKDAVTGTPLSFARCEWQENATEIGLFQDGQNVVAKSRTTTDGETSAFTDLYSIDLATVVQ